MFDVGIEDFERKVGGGSSIMESTGQYLLEFRSLSYKFSTCK
jgi:hypothetical protein